MFVENITFIINYINIYLLNYNDLYHKLFLLTFKPILMQNVLNGHLSIHFYEFLTTK